MEKYVNSRVWLRVPGGVEGWNAEDINARIDDYNAFHFPWASSADFWHWLSYEEGKDYTGFSGLWYSTELLKVHKIKEAIV